MTKWRYNDDDDPYRSSGHAIIGAPRRLLEDARCDLWPGGLSPPSAPCLLVARAMLGSGCSQWIRDQVERGHGRPGHTHPPRWLCLQQPGRSRRLIPLRARSIWGLLRVPTRTGSGAKRLAARGDGLVGARRSAPGSRIARLDAPPATGTRSEGRHGRSARRPLLTRRANPERRCGREAPKDQALHWWALGDSNPGPMD